MDEPFMVGMPPPLFFTFRHPWLAIEDDPAILLRSLLQTRKSFNFFLMTTWQSSLYYTNVPLHIRFRKKFHSSFCLKSTVYILWYMVFCFRNCFDLLWKNGILLPKLFWPTVRKGTVRKLRKHIFAYFWPSKYPK